MYFQLLKHYLNGKYYLEEKEIKIVKKIFQDVQATRRALLRHLS